jgi:Asp-tRNA(Asn)/Glu-tRNA(Gln) amidotransferase B subunit
MTAAKKTPAALGFGERVEYKNLNSLRAVAGAVAAEAARQVEIVASGGAVQDVDVAALQAALVAQGARIAWPLPP